MNNPSSPPRLQRRHIAIAAAAALLGTALLLVGKARSGEADTAPAQAGAALTVDVTTPQRTTLARSIGASGSVSARDELLIGSDASGVRLTAVLVDVGSTVQRGQLLARGDDSQLRAQLAQQDALIRQARAESAQADANLERAERIIDSGVYSIEAVQTRRTTAEAAAAKLELALAQRRELDVHIARTQVFAPAAGTIAKRSATVGAVMQPGLELFRLIRDQQVEWLAELPAHAMAQVQPGALARVRLDDGSSVEGRVRLVAPTIDTKTRNGLVHVALPAGTPLRAGGHAQGEIVVDNTAVLTLPEAVVFSRDGQSFVYVVGDDGVAHQTRVGTGARQRGLVEITGELRPGARVVATGAGFVKDGERVQVAQLAGAAS